MLLKIKPKMAGIQNADEFATMTVLTALP